MSDPQLPSALLRRVESVIAPPGGAAGRDRVAVRGPHVPVIWATQVLENMARKGMPSRAEVSDAAMSVEAECVMLNKGPYVVETVRFLRGVLERMSGHTSKRQSMLRRLSVSQSMARAHALGLSW